jgi:uncharacterized protein
MTPVASTPLAAPPGDSDRRASAPGEPGHRAPRSRLAGWMIAGIHGYQLARSGRVTGCRFLPSCSEYAIGAIDQHGAGRGSLLAAGRLLRCHPCGRHGVDPVPDRRTPCSR